MDGRGFEKPLTALTLLVPVDWTQTFRNPSTGETVERSSRVEPGKPPRGGGGVPFPPAPREVSGR